MTAAVPALDQSASRARPAFDRQLAALALGFVALAVTVLTALWLDSGQEAAFGWVRHTLEVENRLSTIASELEEAESGQRGFVLTGKAEFLWPYDRAVYRVETELDALAVEVSDNARQVAAVERLRGAVRRRLALLQQGLTLYQQGDVAGARDVGRLVQGRAAMDEARAIVTGMRAAEERLLQLRRADAQSQAATVALALLASAIAAVALGAAAYLDGRRRLRAAVLTGEDLSTALRRAETEALSRQAAEDQVRQMQRLESVGQLTGGIAHDFNNMLAVILGSLELGKRRLTGSEDPRLREAIDGAMDGAHRAAQLTRRLLAFSRQQPLSPIGLDVNRLVAAMSELLRRTIGEQLEVETVLAGGLWAAFVDPGQLENALLNLAVNGRDAMPDGGKLTIETANAHLSEEYAAENPEAEPGQYVLMSVSDTGIGMPAEVVGRAFDPFFTTKAPGQGTGLGLSQVFGFVKQSGGHLKLYSEPGVGTTVKLYLPRHRGAAEAAQSPAPAARPLRAAAGETVLVVEDDDRVRRLSVESLRELGYAVLEAEDAARAMAYIAADEPRIDLLFTDVVMPAIDGRRLADEARARRPGLRVLYTTGYTRNAIVHNGVLEADVAVLPKPYTLEQLANAVRRVLDAEP